MSVKTVTYKKDVKLSAHFSLHEFKCSASATIKYSEELIAMLEKIFTKCPNISKGIVTSGYRTPAYSIKVGGSKADAHTCGIAVDIIFYDKKNKVIAPKYIACIAQELGFGGIGVMNNSIHLDVRHLGGYTNKKWWGDETKGYSLSTNGKDFYGYYKLDKGTVYSTLGIATTTPSPAPVKKPTTPTIKVGSTVKVQSGAKDVNSGKKIALWALARKYKVKSLSGKKAVLTYNGAIFAAISTDYLKLV